MNITDNKSFCKTVKYVLLYKTSSSGEVILAEDDDRVIADEKEVGNPINDFFSNVVLHTLRMLIDIWEYRQFSVKSNN